MKHLVELCVDKKERTVYEKVIQKGEIRGSAFSESSSTYEPRSDAFTKDPSKSSKDSDQAGQRNSLAESLSEKSKISAVPVWHDLRQLI